MTKMSRLSGMKKYHVNRKEKISRLPGQPAYRDIFFHINTHLDEWLHKAIMFARNKIL